MVSMRVDNVLEVNLVGDHAVSQSGNNSAREVSHEMDPNLLTLEDSHNGNAEGNSRVEAASRHSPN